MTTTAEMEIVTPLVAPPADWVATVRALESLPELARLILPAEQAELVGGRWRLHPWTPGADLGALVRWVEHLDPTAPVAVTRLEWPMVAVYGALAGQPVALVADSWRLPAPPAPLTVTLLRELAALEPAGELTDVPLPLEQQADPLRDLLPPPPSPPAPAAPRPSPRPRADRALSSWFGVAR